MLRILIFFLTAIDFLSKEKEVLVSENDLSDVPKLKEKLNSKGLQISWVIPKLIQKFKSQHGYRVFYDYNFFPFGRKKYKLSQSILMVKKKPS